MAITSKIDRFHEQVKQNKWLRYFTIFNRIALAAGFLPSGYVKIIGERFTDLHNNHPMGHYLESLHLTGYYYTFIGIMQITAAILLLIPRTATLGAVIYFPIILNICILSLSVCFVGSLLSSPLMVLANLYLLCWDYDKLKYIFFRRMLDTEIDKKKINGKFPLVFFSGVVVALISVVAVITNAYTIEPLNTLSSCKEQCNDSADPEVCNDFCDCVHTQGKPYYKCAEDYKTAMKSK